MRLVIDESGVHIDWADPELSLTTAQRRAMRTDEEVVVIAGAGAGKTHTLSLRYVHLLLQLSLHSMPDIESVLVLTFTEKAASEMADRCYRRLLALAEAIRTQRETLDALPGPESRPLGAHLSLAFDRLRDSFDRARIGTFHAFCARILREFPAESSLAGRVQVTDAIEADQAVEAALEAALRQVLRERPEDLPRLLDALGSRRALMAAGRAALDRRSALEPILEDHAKGRVRLETRLGDAAISPSEASRFVDEIAIPTLRALCRVAAPGGGRWATELARTVEALQGRPRPTDPVDAALESYAAYRTCLDAVLTSDQRLRRFDHHSVLGTRAQWPDRRRHQQARAAMQVLQARCADWEERARVSRSLPIQADRTLISALEAFGRFVLDARDHLHAHFRREDVIDFTDMQIRAVRAALTQPSVRSALRDRFRYLMVDEFQDTDALQWSLVEALGREGSAPSDRIFLVGDPKQAIYGFRGGDITLFRRATSTLGTPPVLLADNFRSKPELIQWFNAAFPPILQPRSDEAPWEAPYEPMRAGRREAGGSVTLLLDTSDDPRWEPKACAQLIATELLSEDYRDLAAHPSPPIAILLRRRTHLPHYEAALRALNIPFLVAQGVGFWQRPEILDLVNTLHALATGNPASIAGALRSPLFCLDDQDLFDLPDLATFGRTPLSPQPSENIRRADQRFRELLALRYRLSTSQLVQRLADLAQHAWHLEPAPAGRQAMANAGRLVAMSARFDDRGQEGLLHAAEAFLRLVLAETRAAEAIIAPTRARVVLMTIHAAKGLEFPTVVIPELHSRIRPDTDPLAMARLGDGAWRIATTVPDAEAEVQRRTRPGLLNALREVRKSEQYAEYRRLFYVAATRARDALVLVGEAPRASDLPPRHPTWAELLADSLPPTTRTLSLSDLQRPARHAEADSASSRRTLAPLPPRAEPIEVSASSLDLFATCPARWYRSVHLGIPELTARQWELARTLAATRGRVIHSALEDGIEADPGRVRARWLSAALTAGCSLEDATSQADAVITPLRRASSDPHLQRLRQREGRAEVSFRVPAGPVVLRGQIDHLVREDAGWVVIDYKSEAVTGSVEVAAARHQRQLQAYAWAASRVLSARSERVVAGEVYFTDIGQSHRLGPWTPEALEGIPHLLDQVAQTAQMGWEQVEATATQQARPCDRCGFRGRGCSGTR